MSNFYTDSDSDNTESTDTELSLPEEIIHNLQPMAPAQQLATTYIHWEVHAIIDSYVLDGTIYYRVQWAPLGSYEDSWEPAAHCLCDRLIREYFERRFIAEHRFRSHP